MRILIDSSQIPVARTGVGVYAEHLIREIAALLRPEDMLFVLVQDDDELLLHDIAAQPNVRAIRLRSHFFRSRLLLAFYEQIFLPWVLLYCRIDLIHSLHYTFPFLCPCSRIVTLHDMTFFLWPQMHTRARRIVMPFFIKMALRHAEAILFVSKATRKDAEALFGKGVNLRFVTPLGVDRAYFNRPPDETIASTLSLLKIQKPYVLFLGTLEPRKNVIRLVEAFEHVGQQYHSHTLVIAGGLGWHFEAALQFIENSSMKARIHRLGYVSKQHKHELLAGCDLLAYPSLYEGFGLPVLEGMAAGVPVVTSNVSSLPEVVGDAAATVDPSSKEQISNALELVLSDKIYGDWLRKAGKARAREFTWERTARMTYAAYLKTLGSTEALESTLE